MTYAPKLTRADGMIDWQRPAVEIERQIRALTPWPGTFFNYGDEQIKVLKAAIIPGQSGNPGTLLDDRFIVACGQQALQLISLQRAGKNAADGAALLRGLRLPPGHVFA